MRINLALPMGISEVIARSVDKGNIERQHMHEMIGTLEEEDRETTMEAPCQRRERVTHTCDSHILAILAVVGVTESFDTRLAISKTSGGQSVAEVV